MAPFRGHIFGQAGLTGEHSFTAFTGSQGSGTGGIIVVDLASGDAIRRLTGDRSTPPENGFVPVIEGETLLQRHEDGSTVPFRAGNLVDAGSRAGNSLAGHTFCCP